MGTPAYNLVIVSGEKKELDEFQKLLAFRQTVYGSKWVGAFGLLIEKNESHLKYFFNSKFTKANLDYISAKYKKLGFTGA